MGGWPSTQPLDKNKFPIDAAGEMVAAVNAPWIVDGWPSSQLIGKEKCSIVAAGEIAIPETQLFHIDDSDDDTLLEASSKSRASSVPILLRKSRAELPAATRRTYFCKYQAASLRENFARRSAGGLLRNHKSSSQ